MLGAPLEMGFTISVQNNVLCKLYSSLWPTRLPTHINVMNNFQVLDKLQHTWSWSPLLEGKEKEININSDLEKLVTGMLQ